MILRFLVSIMGMWKRLWMEFLIKMIGDYYDLYFKYDVFYFFDVFKNFRFVCIENYDFDFVWYCIVVLVWFGFLF